LSNKLTDQTIALAGVVQACHLVDQLSKTGEIPDEHLQPLINSLFEFSPESVESVYGGCQNILPGLRILSEILSGKAGRRYGDTLRYTMGVLHLEKKLHKNSEMLSIIRSRLDHTAFQKEHFSQHSTDICASISAVYQDTLSKLGYRIKVTGSIKHLQNTRNADKILTLLFAAVRAAIMWRQVGGQRWQLIFGRSRMITSIQQIQRGL
jgi:high frequency lysogenization protein